MNRAKVLSITPNFSPLSPYLEAVIVIIHILLDFCITFTCM